MSTSRAYLAKRLKAIGRHDLVEAAERGEVTLHSAAIWTGLISQQHTAEGNGSQNVSKRKAWALLQAERQYEARPEHTQPTSSQEFSPRTLRKGLKVGPRPDLAAALAEWEEAQKKPAPRDREPAPAASPPEPERTPFPSHPAIPCTRCQHPQAAAAMRQILNDYVAACRGESHVTGSTLPRACCQWAARRPDP